MLNWKLVIFCLSASDTEDCGPPACPIPVRVNRKSRMLLIRHVALIFIFYHLKHEAVISATVFTYSRTKWCPGSYRVADYEELVIKNSNTEGIVLPLGADRESKWRHFRTVSVRCHVCRHFYIWAVKLYINNYMQLSQKLPDESLDKYIA